MRQAPAMRFWRIFWCALRGHGLWTFITEDLMVCERCGYMRKY